MNNSMYKRVCIVGLFSLLVACGGGGGGDDSSSSSSSTTASDNGSAAASSTGDTSTTSATDDSSTSTTVATDTSTTSATDDSSTSTTMATDTSTTSATDDSSTSTTMATDTSTTSATDDSSTITTVAADLVEEEPAEVTNDEQAAVDMTSLSELVVDSSNELLSEYTLFVGIDTGNTDRAYVSICEEFVTKDEGGYKVDYDTCLLRGPLNEGVLAANLVLGSAQQELIVAIWTFDGSQPTYHVWNYDENSSNQSLMIN
ncbi:hypothetical protein [uncultured Shewanella sp.]|uniref:hypothetical protein n=1 Tax=uncultured Shewanella sp. TaxID=173975 RepID=UPI00260939FA|nr:hypothetical protein [uncultured Shewanella sp.]